MPSNALSRRRGRDPHPAAETTPEQDALAVHELAIERNLGEIGTHLMEIRDGQLFKVAGFRTFEGYCKGRWQKSRSWAYRLMAGAEVENLILSPVGDKADGQTEVIPPRAERQLRPLAPLRDDPEAVRETWQEATDIAGGQEPTETQVKEAVSRRTRAPQPVEKKGPVPHPATFPGEVLVVMAELLDGWKKVLDPFAGTGQIHRLAEAGFETVGVEIEPEWAELDDRTKVGDALNLSALFKVKSFDAIATSPTYGNRFADAYNASDPEARRSYQFDLGRELAENNSGQLQWGEDYRDFHVAAWREAFRMIKPGGRFVLNIKDHIRDGHWEDVAGWHVGVLCDLGLKVFAIRPVMSGGLGGLGANGDKKAPAELVIGFDLPK